ncbi:MAG: MFS transporter [Chloroflexota bacterium]|nr:MFS transporter [Chloroflexota bacterium]
MLTRFSPWRPAKNPVPIYLLLSAGQAFCFSLIFTVNMVYQVTVVGLSPLQLVLVGTALEATCFLFEVPTGIMADIYSRRLSILIGIALIGGGFTLEGSIPAFWAVIGAQVLWGIGYTFTSGATEAWITDEIGEEAVGPVFLRGGQMWLIGGLAGTLFSVALGLVTIQLPMILAGIGMFVLAIVLYAIMPERHMHVTPREERSTFTHAMAIARDGFRLVRNRPVVKVIVVISLIVGLASEAFDRLSTPSVIDRFEFPVVFGSDSPVLWFGISGVVGTVLGLAASEIFKRRNPESLGTGVPARLLAFMAAIQVGTVVVFVLSGNLWIAFAMLWLRGVLWAVSAPVEAAWLNRNLESSSRATVISMVEQANAIGQVAGGPALGWVGPTVSVRAALLGSALVLSPTVALYRRMIVRDRGAGEEVIVAPAD